MPTKYTDRTVCHFPMYDAKIVILAREREFSIILKGNIVDKFKSEIAAARAFNQLIKDEQRRKGHRR